MVLFAIGCSWKSKIAEMAEMNTVGAWFLEISSSVMMAERKLEFGDVVQDDGRSWNLEVMSWQQLIVHEEALFLFHLSFLRATCSTKDL